MRKHVWKQKALIQATKALFLAKYVLKDKENLEQKTMTSELKSNETD